MSTVVKDLGAVSAYAYAVEKGYTGTEAEFAELMADYAEVGQRAEDAAESALNSKTAAQTAATTATNKASEATTAAQTATTKAGEAQTSAQTASSKASEASQSASQASGYAQTAETAKTDAQTAKTQAETARDNAVTAKTAAETAQGKAEDAQAAAESVAESIPSDYTQLSEDVSGLKSGLNSLSDDISETSLPVSFTDGKAVATANGNYATDETLSCSAYTQTNGYKIIAITMPILNHIKGVGIAFYDESKTFISSVKCFYYTTLSENAVRMYYAPIPENAVYYRSTWLVSTDSRFGNFSATLLNKLPYEKEVVTAGNLLDVSKLTLGARMGTTGNVTVASTMCYTDLIPVEQGDVIVASFRYDYDPKAMAYIAAFNERKNTVNGAGAENVTSYTVPEGVAYVVISALASWMNMPLARICKHGVVEKFQPYMKGVDAIANNAYANASNMIKYPLSSMPEYIIKNLAYKNLGALSKGYVCFVCDDGRNQLATYTLPTVISKGVPITMAVMSSSEVFADATSTETVVDAVNNHGCEIAQHGLVNWDNYDEYTLNRFFDTESAYFASIGLTPYGAVCPSHRINDMIRAVAGGRFGCLRSGFSGSDGNVVYYDNYMNGARSNINGLSCYSVNDGTLATQKQWIDTAIANHYLCIIFWHDVDFASDMDFRAKFEAILDYAVSTGVDIITMKDIPKIK